MHLFYQSWPRWRNRLEKFHILMWRLCIPSSLKGRHIPGFDYFLRWVSENHHILEEWHERILCWTRFGNLSIWNKLCSPSPPVVCFAKCDVKKEVGKTWASLCLSSPMFMAVQHPFSRAWLQLHECLNRIILSWAPRHWKRYHSRKQILWLSPYDIHSCRKQM